MASGRKPQQYPPPEPLRITSQFGEHEGILGQFQFNEKGRP